MIGSIDVDVMQVNLGVKVLGRLTPNLSHGGYYSRDRSEYVIVIGFRVLHSRKFM